MPTYIPSLAALESDDDAQLVAEIRLARLRSQVAIVRSLADHVEHLARPLGAEGLSQQLLEEMERTGHLLLQTVRSVCSSPPVPESGVFVSRFDPPLAQLMSDAHRATSSRSPYRTDSF